MKISAKMQNKAAVQQRNANRIRALQASGRMGQGIKKLALLTFGAMRRHVHKDTAATFAAIRVTFAQRSPTNVTAAVYVGDSPRNPKSGARPSSYAHFENARGGSHAFLDKSAQDSNTAVSIEIAEMSRIVIEGA